MARQALTPEHYPYSDPAARTFSLGVQAMGSVWLSGSTAGRLDRASGKMLVEGDLPAQARLVLEKSRVVLEAGGFGLADISSMVQYVPPAAVKDLPRLDPLYRELFAGALPAIATVVVKSLLRGRALIEIESVAGGGAAAGITTLPAVTGRDTAAAREALARVLEARGLAASQIVKSTRLVTEEAFARAGREEGGSPSELCVVVPHLVDDGAGVQILASVARDATTPLLHLHAEGVPAAGGVEAQCREIYDRLDRQLRAAGSGLEWIVKTTEFVTPDALADYRRTADVRRELFEQPYPAATGVICSRLATAGAQIAIQVAAVRKAA